MISSTSYVTKWYITLFTNSFPFQMQLRIWDAFFLEGQDVIVIVAVAIIWTLKGKPRFCLSYGGVQTDDWLSTRSPSGSASEL